MISYLVDGVLFAALLWTAIRVGMMYKELRRLRNHHGDYQRIFDQTGAAIETVENAVRDINAHGSQILLSLGERIDSAQDTAEELRNRGALVQETFDKLDQRANEACATLQEIEQRLAAIKAEQSAARIEPARPAAPLALVPGDAAAPRGITPFKPRKPGEAPASVNPVFASAQRAALNALMPQPKQRPVEWPTLGERLSHWKPGTLADHNKAAAASAAEDRW